MGRLTGGEWQRFRDGDESLFRRLVEEHSPRLLAVVRPFAADLDEAHDLLQETWRRVYEKRMGYSGSGTLLGWLYAVCRSVCLAEARKRSSRSEATLEPARLMGSSTAGPDSLAEQAQLQRSIRVALLELPERERDVVILRMLDGVSTRETAERLGCAEGTVKATLHHALKKLKRSMEVWVR